MLANNKYLINESEMFHLFLYGDEKLKFYENQSILKVYSKYTQSIHTQSILEVYILKVYSKQL